MAVSPNITRPVCRIRSPLVFTRSDEPPRRRLRTTTARIVRTLVVAVAALIAPQVASANTCVQATPGTYQWQGFGFTPQTDMFTYYIHARPQQPGTDTLVGLSQGPATRWSQLAAIVRFNTNGYIDVRDGDVYRAGTPKRYDNYNWSGDLRLQVDMRRKTYSVWFWSLDGDTWLLLAKDYRFRTEQTGVTQLDHFTAEAETGVLDACARDPDPWTRVGDGATQWRNAPTDPQRNRHEFFVRPDTANMDGLIALAKGPQSFWSNLAAIVRFNRNGLVDVRNGSVYQADTAFAYVPGQTYRIVVWTSISRDPATVPHAYTVYISAVGGTVTRIASNYLFRTEQQGVPDLDHWIAEAELGGLTAYLAPERWGY